MKENPLISVIVPIYNVAPYLRACLDSLAAQTMKEIEIVMIDDGSTDGSGAIADEYVSSSFPIFRVIHTANGGVSAARNRGIDEARGEWIMFVDSDDWVETRFCELPYQAAVENGADLVIFGCCCADKRGRFNRLAAQQAPTIILDEISAHKDGKCFLWNKLYKKQLFENLRFPQGKTYEDVAKTHILVHRANRIVSLSEALYYYGYRDNGISHSLTEANQTDSFRAYWQRYKDLVSYGYPEEDARTSLYMPAISFLSRSTTHNSDLYIDAEKIVDGIKGIPKQLTKKQQLALVAWRIDKRLFYFLSRATKRT